MALQLGSCDLAERDFRGGAAFEPRLSERLRQLGTYCFVGLASVGLALSVLAGLHALMGVNYLVAFCVSFAVSSGAGYLLNARFTFSTHSDRKAAARYVAVNAALLGVNTAAMTLLVDVLGMWYIAAAILLAILNAPVGFLAQRLITYRPEPRSRAVRL
jgi:putative flippase GtrA